MALRAGVVGGCFGLAALAGFRWWERWDRERLCTGIFSECFDQSLRPLSLGVPVLLLAAWLVLFALRVRRAWLVVLLAVPLNGLAAVALLNANPRFVVVVVASAATWATAGLAVSSIGRPSRA
jgi:hypothetical protein